MLKFILSFALLITSNAFANSSVTIQVKHALSIGQKAVPNSRCYHRDLEFRSAPLNFALSQTPDGFIVSQDVPLSLQVTHNSKLYRVDLRYKISQRLGQGKVTLTQDIFSNGTFIHSGKYGYKSFGDLVKPGINSMTSVGVQENGCEVMLFTEISSN